MTFLPSTMILRVLPALVCMSLAACDGRASMHLEAAATAAGSAKNAAAPAGSMASPARATGKSTAHYGTYLHPYAVDSLWNSRPVKPVFGTFVIPRSRYFSTVASGAYSTGVFLGSATDTPMTVVGRGTTATNTNAVADPDNGASRVITIPRWPAGVLPASGTDGHADIVDPVTNTIHSFWQLKQIDGRWTAALYSWSNLSGTGWGDPAHYYQGARAVGIPASAGLIRKHEIKDGQPAYTHALALSLTHNALSNGENGPAYVFPATAADNTPSSNTGSIPQGALLMLPPGFDTSAIVDPGLRKIAETLKSYGAYVVDRNDGTPFVIYVENDAGFHLMPKGWDNKIAGQLDMIRAGLRQVVSTQGWVDAKGNDASAAIKAQQTMNILSMRGPWQRQAGSAAATFDSASQRLVFDATTTKAVHVNSSNNGMTPVKWAVPTAGSKVRFSVSATGGATLRLQLITDGRTMFDSKDLAHGQSLDFAWPANAKVTLTATSGTEGPSSVRANLVPAA